jgi:hypothetical protein
MKKDDNNNKRVGIVRMINKVVRGKIKEKG